MRRRVFLALVVLSACGGSGGRAATAKSDAPAVTVASTAPSTSTSAAPKSRSTDELKGSLLEVTDLPTGFAVEARDAGGGARTGLCGKPSTLAAVPDDAEAQVLFSKGTLGPFVGEFVGFYKQVDRAKEYMAKLREAGTSCSSWEQPGDDGKPSKTTVSPLSFPVLGDETFAVRTGGDGSADLVWWRQGGVVVKVTNAGFTIDSDLTLSVSKKAAQKASDRLS